ncbi:excinuclease ABC subunit UvrC [Microvirga sp. 3-52]|uniref:excinuclease ABC subunit UvrC n=1 Tax=Microvirga sp. 3-52 TaxID=2792425 RepID=UPI001ACC3443|nr:excinuclease ABC subunit UvrC [Microvirga sp. 3-52]MBO1906255.1 excinuclease ABC subunit UvrC [Microvirga sp. 3-52]MBS7453568.1 excinuclease ABC subunit UvrC [Microvirga sp. 3-52]
MSRNTTNDVPPDILDNEEDDESTAVESGSDVEFDLEVNPDSVQRGTEVIRHFWNTLPNAPGVYRMLDAKGDVLYVGKAKSLKSRVGSYARGQAHSNRIARMIGQTASMEFVTTATETEALLLEANLIKQLKPRYNVLLRDDKSLPYILLTADHEAPQLVKHRGARKRKGDYYGPFASVWAVNRTINALQRAFLLRSCNDSYYENRTRPCLLFQIKRCSGPCTNEISSEEYAELVSEARAFLSGKSNAVKQRITDEMQAAAEELEFERAARCRDRLAALSAIQGVQGINTQSVEEADVFALDEQAGQFCVEVFFFRNWQNWGNRAYFPKADKSMSREEVLGSFMAQFYDDKPAPRLILLSHEIEDAELMAAALSTRTETRVEIHSPQRGERRQLIEYALRNAREALGRRLADTSSQQKLLVSLGQAFGLPKVPRRVEVYDNSHIMGTNAVGAMVVAGVNGFMKQHYRTFNMKSEELKPGDDYGMMREMLQRRFARLVKEEPRGSEADGPTGDDAFPAWPDLVLIDGGKGQLEAARQALAEVGVSEDDVSLVGIAKGRDRDAGRETFFKPGQPPFKMPPRDPALYFVQRLRDEAHRFAIGAHRAKRKRELVKNPLDEIPGIGPTRKRALLHHFGTVKAIQRAALEDLMKAPGVNAATARAVFDFFHERS